VVLGQAVEILQAAKRAGATAVSIAAQKQTQPAPAP
jgi:hypothetical protein